MLTITIPATEYYDEKTSSFDSTKERTISLEHSLISISKWEAKWHKPFLTNNNKTSEEIVDYIKCMTITQNVDPLVYRVLTADNFKQIEKYIDDPMTATWFNERETKSHNKEIITSEIIYYWMISFNIPFECQKWHINRLLTLIRVCNIKNQPPKKMSKNELMNRNRALNNARRNALHTKG
jgi:hypothetical protein